MKLKSTPRTRTLYRSAAWTGLALILILCQWGNCGFCQTPPINERPWNRDLIYFVMTDRFLDGDLDNNRPANSDPDLYDATQSETTMYHGGDFRGLELAIQDGYFDKLGVSTIWITPPIRNAWNSSFDLGGPKTGYHGYWAQDFLDIDPHLTSAKSLAGEPYSDNREGRMQHYRDLVSLAHQHGIKIVQDIVCNHVGPLFYYDMNGNQTFDLKSGNEWIAAYKDEGFYNNAMWANVPKWNLIAPQPAGPMTVLGHSIATTGVFQNLAVYGRKGFDGDSLGKGDGEEVTCDFFSLRDFYTRPDAPHFDQLVDEFVAIYAFYVEVIGVDGFRIDTVKHVHHEFWDAFSERLRNKLGPDKAKQLLLFGEVYDGQPAALGKYTYRTDYPDRKDPCLDSLLNFEYCFSLRSYLRRDDHRFGSAKGIRSTMNHMNGLGDDKFYNPTPGADGLNARQKMINFYENHDGLNRFLVKNVDTDLNNLALGLTLLMEGVPCIYYGTELPLQDDMGKVGRDGESGRMTLFPRSRKRGVAKATKSDTFGLIKRIVDLRQQHPALHSGRMHPLWVDRSQTSIDDGSFVFCRYLETGGVIDPTETIIVVVNANPDAEIVTAMDDGVSMKLVSSDYQPIVPQGARLERIALFGAASTSELAKTGTTSSDGSSYARLTAPPRSVAIYKVE